MPLRFSSFCFLPLVATLTPFIGVGVVSAVLPAPALAPEPDPIPRSWQLDLKPGELRLARLQRPDGSVAAYFYMSYRVTNKTGEDVLLAPSFELADGEGTVLRSGRGVPLDVSDAIRKELGNPLIEDQISILGMLLQGDENAKDGLVIWPAGSLSSSELTVYAAGFSGEVKFVSALNPKSKQREQVATYKTLKLRYKTGGDMTNRGTEPFTPFEQSWIMR